MSNTANTAANTAANTGNWEPPASFEEKLRGMLIPPSLYYILRAKHELRRGVPCSAVASPKDYVFNFIFLPKGKPL